MDEKKKKESKKELTPVVKSRIKEKSGFELMITNFLQNTVRDKMIPAVKNMAVDAGVDFLESLFFGQATGRYRSTRNNYGGGDYPRVSYNNRYTPGPSRYSYRDDRMERDNRYRYDFSRLCNDDGTPYDYGQIEKIISSMEELVNQYGEASVADLFSICGVSSVFTDNDWGWRDCRDFNKRMYGRGYILDFAEPYDIRR